MHERCKGRGVQTNRKNGAVGARQNRTWRAPKPDLARANFAVGARQVPSWRANFDLASKKLASTQKTHILQHNNKATQP